MPLVCSTTKNRDILGTAGTIANAVWHATGARVRRFPITIERLIGGLG